jgi:hypothetical protein
MPRQIVSRTVLSLSVSLALSPAKVRADFLIEFTDGHQVTVGRYAEEGPTLKIYTPQGAISFRKADVKRITPVDANYSIRERLETVSAHPSVPPQEAAQGPKERDKKVEPSKGVAAKREQLEAEYKEVSQRISEVWEKDIRDQQLGASPETLAENTRKLNELNQRWHAAIDAARRVTPPDQLPEWAQ